MSYVLSFGLGDLYLICIKYAVMFYTTIVVYFYFFGNINLKILTLNNYFFTKFIYIIEKNLGHVNEFL